MERFKICEKETKTKAYSKEALQKNKAEDKMSSEKEEMKEWFDDVVGTLTVGGHLSLPRVFVMCAHANWSRCM